MIDKIKYPFEPTGHKSIMLFLLCAAVIAVHILSLGIDFVRERYTVSVVKFVTIIVVSGLLYFYIRTLKVKLYAFILLVVIEIELTFIIVCITFKPATKRANIRPPTWKKFSVGSL